MIYLGMTLGSHFKDPSNLESYYRKKWRRNYLVGNVFICLKGAD